MRRIILLRFTLERTFLRAHGYDVHAIYFIGSSNKRPRIDDSSEDTSTLMQETKAEPQITDGQ